MTISKKDLDKIGVFECFKTYPNGIIDNEFHHTYITQLDLSFSSLIPQKEEVEALKLVSMFDFFELLENSENNGHFIASNSDYYNIVAETILKKIT